MYSKTGKKGEFAPSPTIRGRGNFARPVGSDSPHCFLFGEEGALI